MPRLRSLLLVVLSGLASVGALAAGASFATADEISGASQWVEVATVGVLLGLAAFAVLGHRPGWRVWVEAGLGIVCVTFSLGTVGVFAHGYVISTLPAATARLAVLLAVVGGSATAVLAIVVEYDNALAQFGRERTAQPSPSRRPPPRSRARG
jgi:hypothetical protein